MIRQRMIAGLVAATALVGITACGSDSKSSSTTLKVTTTSNGAATTTSAKIGTATTSASEGSVPDVTVGDITTPSLTGECVDLQKDLPDLSNATNFNTDDVNKAFTTLKSRVPDDLKDDIDTLKNALQPFYDAVEKAGGDATKAMQDPEVVKQAQTALTDPKFTTASQALNDWFTKGCPSG